MVGVEEVVGREEERERDGEVEEGEGGRGGGGVGRVGGVCFERCEEGGEVVDQLCFRADGGGGLEIREMGLVSKLLLLLLTLVMDSLDRGG